MNYFNNYRDQCLTDLAYSLITVEKYEEAIKYFGSIQQETFSSIIGLALAQFKGDPKIVQV